MSAGNVAENVDDKEAFDNKFSGGDDNRNVQFTGDERERFIAAQQELTTEDRVSAGEDAIDNHDDDLDGDDGDDAIPWHHWQLYHLYGDEADYFLHPKFTTATISRCTSTKPQFLESHCDIASAKTIGI